MTETYIVVAKPGADAEVVAVDPNEIDDRIKEAIDEGYFEMAPSPLGRNNRTLCLWFDEDGIRKQLSPNRILRHSSGHTMDLLGTIVVTDSSAPDTLGLDRSEATLVAETLNGQL